MQWFVRHAVRAIFPMGGALPGVREERLKPLLADMMREAPGIFKLGIWAATFFFHLSPIVTVYLPVPAFLLPAGLLDKHAHRLMSHRWYHLRMLCYTLKFVGGLSWGMDPEVRKLIHVRPLGPDPGTFITSETVDPQ
jgi:hypothetical protein